VTLPRLAPMLAVPAAPFDSEAYSFEVKWDGVRALAAVEESSWRLWGREGTDYTARYPELAVLRRLPSGTLVDGECVAVGAAGRPDLSLLLRRHGLADPWKIGLARRWCAVGYVLFDLLYDRGRCWLREPLAVRRAALAELCADLADAAVVFSGSVLGSGRAFYAAALAAGHEGVVAKRLASPYRPGRRSPAWLKIKPRSLRTLP
jgi:bifunctional non-homologous end joining protein LigD